MEKDKITYPEFKKIPNMDYRISKDGCVYNMKTQTFISVSQRGTINICKDWKRTHLSARALVKKLFKKELANETLAKLKKYGIKVKLRK